VVKPQQLASRVKDMSQIVHHHLVMCAADLVLPDPMCCADLQTEHVYLRHLMLVSLRFDHDSTSFGVDCTTGCGISHLGFSLGALGLQGLGDVIGGEAAAMRILDLAELMTFFTATREAPPSF
jgi:hypothetical protein